MRLAPRRRNRRRQFVRVVAAMRMPLPPPPADALTSTGKPISLRRRRDALVRLVPGVCPGTTGTPARCISARAAIFDPIALIASGGRTDEKISPPCAGFGERRVLGEEPVARDGPHPRRGGVPRR